MKRLYARLVLWLLAPALQLREERRSMRFEALLLAIDKHIAASIGSGRSETAKALRRKYGDGDATFS